MARRQAIGGRWRVTVGCGLLAIVLTAATGGLWTVLLTSNLRTSPALPWSVGVMALLLGLLAGHSTSPAAYSTLRGERSRKAPLLPEQWIP
jgi:hypothetical protein